MKAPALAAALFLLAGWRASADDATGPNGEKYLVPNNDVGIASDGATTDLASYEVRVGELHAPGGECYIMPLRIPALPAGKRIATIHFKAQITRIDHDGEALGNADLYTLGVRDTNKALPSDYYQGPKPDPRATLLQANILTPSSPVRSNSRTGPFVETTAETDAAFLKYLNDLCATPGNTGKYIILRISYDTDPIPRGNNAYNVVTTGADGDEEIPTFTYTLAPK